MEGGRRTYPDASAEWNNSVCTNQIRQDPGRAYFGRSRTRNSRTPQNPQTEQCAIRLLHRRIQRGHRTGEDRPSVRSEEHTSELQSLMRISYAVFCLKKKKKSQLQTHCTNSNKKTIAYLTKTTKKSQHNSRVYHSAFRRPHNVMNYD